MDLLIGNSTSTCHGSQGIGIDLILKLAITMLMVRKTLGTSGMKHRIVFKALTFLFLALSAIQARHFANFITNIYLLFQPIMLHLMA